MTGLIGNVGQASLTAGAVIALLLVLGPRLSRRLSPRWRYWAWLLVAVRLLLPLDLSLPRAPVQVAAPAGWSAPEYDGMEGDVRAADDFGYNGAVFGETHYEVWYTDDSQVDHHLYDFVLVRLEGTGGSWSLSFRWERIWGAGAAVSLLLLAAGYLRLLWLVRRRRRPAGEEDLSELLHQGRRLGLGRTPGLYRVSGLTSPCLVGLFRPAILLPGSLTGEALSWSLAHELTHWRRRDLWFQLAMSLSRCVHWFNPLVWLMVRAARRDMELCCDYDLLRGEGMNSRQAYGRAILEQMTAGQRSFSSLTTGFSGGKKEVFARFRAMMDTAPREKGRAALALAAAAVVLSGALVSCQTAEPGTEDSQPGESEAFTVQYAWVETVDLDNRTVAYLPLTEEQWQNREALWDDLGNLERKTAPLAEDAEVYHTYDGERYPLNSTALVYTLNLSQAGLPGQLSQAETGDQTGTITGVWLDAPSRLDLAAADLDFTGYCGEIYAHGGPGGLLWSDGAIWLDPCDSLGQDSDHARYALPTAEALAAGPEDLRPYLDGTASSHYPARYRLLLLDGEVTWIEGIWEEIQTVPLDPEPDAETPTSPEHMPEYDPDFYDQSGAEDMPEFDPGFYGESGAQPLEPQ